MELCWWASMIVLDTSSRTAGEETGESGDMGGSGNRRAWAFASMQSTSSLSLRTVAGLHFAHARSVDHESFIFIFFSNSVHLFMMLSNEPHSSFYRSKQTMGVSTEWRTRKIKIYWMQSHDSSAVVRIKISLGSTSKGRPRR